MMQTLNAVEPFGALLVMRIPLLKPSVPMLHLNELLLLNLPHVEDNFFLLSPLDTPVLQFNSALAVIDSEVCEINNQVVYSLLME